MSQKTVNKLFGNKQWTSEQIRKKFCGKLLGAGAYRDTYVCKQDPKMVIKIEREMSKAIFANVSEWVNYQNLKDWNQMKPWLAPCYGITQIGNVLLQRRVKITDNDDLYPEKIPSFFTDRKYENFGFIGKQLVCYDYSFMVHTQFRMVKANWWHDGSVTTGRDFRGKNTYR